MIHLLLLLVCILSVEVFIRSNFLLLIDSILNVSKRVTYVIPQSKISDHWKEYIIPKYSMKMIKVSLQMLLIFLSIIVIFLIGDKVLTGFLDFTFSLNGIIMIIQGISFITFGTNVRGSARD